MRRGSFVLVLMVILMECEAVVEVEDILASSTGAADVSHTARGVLKVPIARGLRVPQRVNVVVLGNITDDELLDAVEDRLPYVVVPWGEEQVTTKRDPTRSTKISLDVEVKLHRMPRVASLLERLIQTTMRPDEDTGTSCVDVHRVAMALQHLVESLGLHEHMTIFLVRTSIKARYGYRSGLTRKEMDQLDADREWLRKLEVLVTAAPVSSIGPPQDFRKEGEAAWVQWFDANVVVEETDAQLHSLTRHMATKGSAAQQEILRQALSGASLSDCLVWSWINDHRLAFFDITHHDAVQMAAPVVHKHSRARMSMRHALSSAIRHVAAPGVAAFPVVYAERVVFTLYVLRLQSSYDPRANFDWKRFSEEMERLRAPGQEFSFRVQEVGPEMAIAFQASLRSAVLPSESHKVSSHVVYVDSKALRDMLKVHNHAHATSDDTTTSRSSVLKQRQVSIVLVSTAYPYPVLVDRYYVAKSLADMVVVSQSNFEAYHARIQCGGLPIDWDLRNPMRHALAATTTHLAGLVPTHLTYSPLLESVAQEWLWSTGDGPFSHSSHGAHFSSYTADLVRRNYVLAALERSLKDANNATVLLQRLPDSFQSPITMWQVSSLASMVHSTRLQLWTMWDAVAANLTNVKNVVALDRLTRNYTLAVNQVANALQGLICKTSIAGHAKEVEAELFSWTPILVGVTILDIVVLIAYFLLRARLRSNKLKVN